MHSSRALLAPIALLAGCSLVTGLGDLGGGDASVSDGAPVGTEGQPCYANQTCNAGLTCLSNLCVQLPEGGADAAANDVAQPDAVVDVLVPPPDAACKDPKLFPADGGVIFCGAAGDGGALYCSPGQQCCLGGSLGMLGYAANTCITWGGTCMNPPDAAIPIECEQKADCTANGAGLCCLHGATAPAVVSGCDVFDLQSTGGTGITCAAPVQPSCPFTGDLRICSANSECPSGFICTPFRWKGIDLGYCH